MINALLSAHSCQIASTLALSVSSPDTRTEDTPAASQGVDKTHSGHDDVHYSN